MKIEVVNMDEGTRIVLRDGFEESPVGKFLQQTGYFCKTPDYTNFVFYDDINMICQGGFTLTHGNLSFLTDEENCHHTIKLQNIFIRKDSRGGGLFGSILDAVKDFAEDHGVFLYLLARSFKLDMPTIRRPEEYVEWIKHHNDDIEMVKNTDEEWVKSKLLLDTYKKYGFCSFDAEPEDVSKKKWLEQILCAGIDNVTPALQEILLPRIHCEDNPKTYREQMHELNKHRKKRNKKLQKYQKRFSSRKSA